MLKIIWWIFKKEDIVWNDCVEWLPQHNGVIDWMNKILLEVVSNIFGLNSLSNNLWVAAVNIVCSLMNIASFTIENSKLDILWLSFELLSSHGFCLSYVTFVLSIIDDVDGSK